MAEPFIDRPYLVTHRVPVRFEGGMSELSVEGSLPVNQAGNAGRELTTFKVEEISAWPNAFLITPC